MILDFQNFSLQVWIVRNGKAASQADASNDECSEVDWE
jgi:hypothetical protein